MLMYFSSRRLLTARPLDMAGVRAVQVNTTMQWGAGVEGGQFSFFFSNTNTNKQTDRQTDNEQNQKQKVWYECMGRCVCVCEREKVTLLQSVAVAAAAAECSATSAPGAACQSPRHSCP